MQTFVFIFANICNHRNVHVDIFNLFYFLISYLGANLPSALCGDETYVRRSLRICFVIPQRRPVLDQLCFSRDPENMRLNTSLFASFWFLLSHLSLLVSWWYLQHTFIEIGSQVDWCHFGIGWLAGSFGPFHHYKLSWNRRCRNNDVRIYNNTNIATEMQNKNLREVINMVLPSSTASWRTMRSFCKGSAWGSLDAWLMGVLKRKHVSGQTALWFEEDLQRVVVVANWLRACTNHVAP